MKSRLPAVCIGAVFGMLSLGHWPSPICAQELSAKELKRAVKQADKAFDAGRYGEAIGLYDQILASTSGTDPRRGDALFASAMIRLSAGGHQDVAGARQHLEELAAFSPTPSRLAVPVLQQLFAELDTARSEVERSAAKLEAKTAAYHAQREQAAAEREEAAGESEAAGDRVRSLESRLRKARSELSGCQEELQTKEEALQKLRDALVGGN